MTDRLHPVRKVLTGCFVRQCEYKRDRAILTSKVPPFGIISALTLLEGCASIDDGSEMVPPVFPS